MRVAINALPVSPGMTGIGSYALDLVYSTARFGRPHTYLYITWSQGPKLPLNGRHDLRQLMVQSPTFLWEQLNLPTELASSQVDLYHSPLFTCPVVREIPSVITVHDLIPETRPDLCSPAFLEFYRSYIGPSVRACEWVVTTSKFSKREVVKHLGIASDKVHVIYQGISEKFSPESAAKVPELRRSFNLPEKYVLFVGMVDPRKNVERLVSAFGKIAPEIPDVSLVIVGRKDDPEYSINSAVEESGAQDRILTLGYVAEDALSPLYAGAHIFAFPSLYEGFGRPVVEAMASGVPVLTSNVSSLPEIAGDAALLVDPEDLDAIANGILSLCRDESLRTRLAERGSKRAREFTHQKFGERLVEFYNMTESTRCALP